VAATIFYGLVCSRKDKILWVAIKPLINDDGENFNFTSNDVRLRNGTGRAHSATGQIERANIRDTAGGRRRAFLCTDMATAIWKELQNILINSCDRSW
jgi:hypothetical protein